MSQITLPVFLLILIGGVVGWLHFGSSGTFVSHGQNFTALLKIDRLPNNQIVGLYQQITLRPDGQLSNDTALVSGVSQLTQMTLNLKQQPFSMNGIVMANFNGINLTLTSVSFHGLPSVQVFSHSSIAEFDQYAAQLQHKANLITAEKQQIEFEQKAAKQREEFLKNVISSTDQLEAENPKLVDFSTSTAPKIQNKYIMLSARMAEILEREKNTPNDVARGQMSVAISQGSIKTDEISVQVNSAHIRYDNYISPLLDRIVTFERTCDRYNEYQDIADACAKFKVNASSFRKNASQVKDALKSLDTTYEAEKVKQREIETVATRIE